MSIFRSDHARSTLPGGSTSQQYTNVDFRNKPDPSLNRPLEKSRVVYNGINITIFAEPIEIIVTQRPSVFSSWPAADRDPALDQTFDCHGSDQYGNWDQGVLDLAVSLEGSWLNLTIFADPIEISVSPEGSYVGGILIDSDPIDIAVSIHSYGAIVEMIKNSWLKWSDIGHLDFTIDKTNVAGERPLDWRGWIYAIKKLGNKVIAYGENGVSALIPSGNAYGLNTIYRIGLKSKQAVAGDESTHYFIDNKGQLWSLGEGLAKLDYSEYLSALGSPVLSWDAANSLLYICDGILGFIYSADSGSLGGGPVNITGIDSQGGNLYVVSSGVIAIPIFKICTDILDAGTRRGKNIHFLEIGTDLAGTLQAAIDYRLDQAADFITTPWQAVDRRGIIYIPCHTKEFRIRVKMDSYEYAELDYITVNGEICRY